MSHLNEAIETLKDTECSFWACPGAAEEVTPMATCSVHNAYAELLRHKKALEEIIECGNQDYMLRFELKWAATLSPMLKDLVRDVPL